MSLSTPEREYQDDTDLDVIQKSHNVKARHLRSPYNSSFWTPSRILFALVLYRCINALSIRTFFQPDEYFQSLEPAWQIAFGKDAGAWITWVSAKSYLVNIH
jgi:phosphatidylinositol glycan class B